MYWWCIYCTLCNEKKKNNFVFTSFPSSKFHMLVPTNHSTPVTSNLMQSIDVYIILCTKTRERAHPLATDQRNQTIIIIFILHWNNGQHLRFKPMLKWNVFDRLFNWSSIWFTYQSNHKNEVSKQQVLQQK